MASVVYMSSIIRKVSGGISLDSVSNHPGMVTIILYEAGGGLKYPNSFFPFFERIS